MFGLFDIGRFLLLLAKSPYPRKLRIEDIIKANTDLRVCLLYKAL